VSLGKPARQVEAQTGSRRPRSLPRGGRAREELVEPLLLDPDTRIVDGDLDRLVHGPSPDRDRSLVRELDRVLDQVPEHVTEAFGIDVRGHARVDLDRYAVTTGESRQVLGRLARHGVHGDVLGMDLQAVGLQAREVEYFRHDPPHPFCVRMDGFDELQPLFVGEAIPSFYERCRESLHGREG
jgi:hypothetical protein